MTVAAARRSETWRKTFASRLTVFAALLAFMLQSYIAQTHVHGAAQDPAGHARIAAAEVPAQGKTPLDNSPIDCPFCQTATLAGVFVAPPALLLYLPLTWVKTVFSLDIVKAVSVTAAHDWQSRAPPRR